MPGHRASIVESRLGYVLAALAAMMILAFLQLARAVAGDYVLVTEWGELGGAGIAKIDPATDQIVARLSMPGSPRHIDADTARRLAYVSQHYGNKISVIKADSLVSADLVIPGLGKAPIGVTLTPEGTRLLVATRGNDSIPSADDRLDVVSLNHSTWPPAAALVTSILTGLHPIQAFVNHTGQYAVVTVRNQPAILVIDLNTYQIVWQAPGLPLTAEPEGGCLHPTQNIVYVALHGMNTLEVLDLDSMKILRHVPIINPGGGPPQPSAVRFTPDGSRAYVSAQTAGRILMFNTTNPRMPVQDTSVHLPTGPQPHDIVWLPSNRAYVANTNNTQQYGSVSIISSYNAVPSIGAPILTDLAGPLSFAYFKSPSEASLPAVHLTVVSHNEEPAGGRPDYTADINYYLSNRKLVKQLAETITSRGAKYNFQSDWNYLTAVAMFDTGAVTANTNGKNIVRWMKEDLGVEVDPHAHESQYNYADVAYLIGQLGVTPSKNVGGFLYDPPDNPQGWEQHEAGVYGTVYPSYFWRADNLWGAATYLHQGIDDASSGMWRPKDRYNFYVDDTTQRLAYIGRGCGGLAGLVQLVDDIQTGKAPSTGFYTANLMLIQDWMDSVSIAQLGATIDSLAPSVAQGRIVWSTLSQTANNWKTQHAAKESRYTCDTASTPPTTYQIEVIEAWVTAPDGNQVYTRVVRPKPSLYPGQRFPALIAITGGTGPGAPLADNIGYRNFAASGFVVVVFNPEGRGSGLPGNLLSQGVEDCNGFVHQDDCKAVIEYTAGLPNVDPGDIGVETASFGIAIGAGALGRYPTLPVKYLVDQEGPHDNRVITFYDAGHEVAVCGHLSTVTDPSPANVAFWTEREAVRYIGNFRGHYLRMQAQLDHAQNPYYFRHAIEMIDAGTDVSHGGSGHNCWTRMNGSDLDNPINTVYPYGDTAHYPKWESGKLSDHPDLHFAYIKEMSAMAATMCAYDVLDLAGLIDYVFSGASVPPLDPGCIYITNGDMDCNGIADVFDVVRLIDYIFSRGMGPCETCGG